MNVLILGAGGMAGHVSAVYFQERGHTVTGFARNKLSFCDTITGDATDGNTVKNVVCSQEFDAVINCIGVLNTDVDSDPADGIYLNSYLPRFLVKCTENKKTKVIHLSTDCIFSGNGSGGYTENSVPDSDTLYGRTKALGEIDDSKNLTFRTSIVGPDINIEGKGLFNWFIKQHSTVCGYSGAIWTGVSTIVLARAIERAIEQNLTGLYHLVNNNTISKFELLKLFSILKRDYTEIIPDDKVKVDKSLVDTRRSFDFTVPDYKQMADEIGVWIDNHKVLYPHYL